MALDDLQAFVRVAETRSFTETGAALGLPRSTVSRRIARLEDELGVQLFLRTTRKVALTELGRVLFERCRGPVDDLEGMAALLADAQDAPSGALRVSMPVDLGSVFGGTIVEAFSRRYPEVRVEATTSDRFVDLIEEGVDVALRVSSKPLSDSSSLVARRLAVLPTFLFSSDRYLDGHAALRRPADLSRHRIVGSAALRRWRLTHVRRGTVETLSATPDLRLENLFMVRDALAAGAGVGWIPSFLSAGTELKRVLPTWELPSATVWAVWPLARQLSPTVRAFVDHLVSDLPSRIEGCG